MPSPWNIRLGKFPFSLGLDFGQLSIAALLLEGEEAALGSESGRSVLSHGEGRQEPW